MANWELAVFDVLPPSQLAPDDRFGYRLLLAAAFSLQRASDSMAQVRSDSWSRPLIDEQLVEVIKHPIAHGAEYHESVALWSVGYFVNNAQTRIHAACVRRLGRMTQTSGGQSSLAVGVGLLDWLKRFAGGGTSLRTLEQLIAACEWVEKHGVSSLLPTKALKDSTLTIDEAFEQDDSDEDLSLALTCKRSEDWFLGLRDRMGETTPSGLTVEWVWAFRALVRVSRLWEPEFPGTGLSS